MENKMIETINAKVKEALADFQSGNFETYNIVRSELKGMIAMLELVTDKKYRYNENGIFEA